VVPNGHEEAILGWRGGPGQLPKKGSVKNLSHLSQTQMGGREDWGGKPVGNSWGGKCPKKKRKKELIEFLKFRE